MKVPFENILPDEKELKAIREFYAETYPVRPLLNLIDAQARRIKELEQNGFYGSGVSSD